MYTLCSHCDAAYEVSPEALVRGHGQLHCAVCECDFDALDRLSRDLPVGIESASIATPANSTQPRQPVPAPTSDPDMAQSQTSLPLEQSEPATEDTTTPASDAAAPLPPEAPAESSDDPETEHSATPRPKPELAPEAEAEASSTPASSIPDLPTPALHAAADNTLQATPEPHDAHAVPAIFQWLEQAAAAPVQPASPATKPAVELRTDALVDVLTAHADFIEPPHEDFTEDHPSDDPLSDSAVAAHDHARAQDSNPPHAADGRKDDLAPIFITAESGNDIIAFPSLDTLPNPSTPDPEAQPDTGTTAPLALSERANHDDPFHPVLDAPTPSFIATPLPVLSPESEQRRWPAWLTVFALLLLLGLLSILAERDTLAADARWRPWLERACATLPCTLAPWHEPSAMQLMTRDVRPHPSVPNALLISASFRNQARWAQLWPRLDLTLSDLNGRAIAQRQFRPDQYLGMNARESLVQPGQTASVTLEVRDPGKQAVAFEFDFR